MKALWQESAARPGQSSSAGTQEPAGRGGQLPGPGSAETPARRDFKCTPNPHRLHVTAGLEGTGVAGLSSRTSMRHQVSHFMA